MGKKSGSRLGMINPDHIFESLKKKIFWIKILKFFAADPGPPVKNLKTPSDLKKEKK
jgi:hypothetical protein